MNENYIKIRNGTKASRDMIEIQTYITQLELNYYRAKRKLNELKILSEKYKKLGLEYQEVIQQLEYANTELAYYQAMVITKNSGRPAKLSIQQTYEIRELRGKGIAVQTIAEQYEISTALVYKVTKDIEVDHRKKMEKQCLKVNNNQMNESVDK